jgi:hypothetical protein
VTIDCSQASDHMLIRQLWEKYVVVSATNDFGHGFLGVPFYIYIYIYICDLYF